MTRIWIIDDEPSICWALQKELERFGYHVDVFASAEQCLDRIRSDTPYPDVVLLDVRLPGQSGLELLGTLRELPSQPAVIVMTAFGDLKVAVDAVRGKAFEYLTKPFDLTTVLNVVERASQNPKAPRSLDSKTEAIATQETILGDSAAMQAVYKKIAIAAQSNAPVLIDGETGTGKSLVARMIHRFSLRAAEPLVFFRPDETHTSESDAELFGTCLPTSISLSGGPNKQPGLLLLAGSGTLVIDEVTHMSIAAQAKLLGAIESGSFQAIASAEPEPLRGRILFTSSLDLEGASLDGAWYEPLAALMRVINIQLPPLRERLADIRRLAPAFLATSDPNKRLSERAVRALENQSWPGNVRELKQAIQYATVHARGSVIEPEDLPSFESAAIHEASSSTDTMLEQSTRAWLKAHSEPADVTAGFLHDRFLAVAERALIHAMLEACGGNRATVAARLGMHRTTLRQKMRRYDL